MSNQTIKIEDLLWAREKLRVFTALERQIKTFLGPDGMEKLVFFHPLIMVALAFSSLINMGGIYLWSKHHGHIYLLTALWPAICAGFIHHYIKSESKKNIFRFIGKFPKISRDIINIIEFHVFNEQAALEEVINWRAKKNMLSLNEIEKFYELFDLASWEKAGEARKHSIELGILMVSLQKFLHANRQIYEAQIYRTYADDEQPKIQSFNGARIVMNTKDMEQEDEELDLFNPEKFDSNSTSS